MNDPLLASDSSPATRLYRRAAVIQESSARTLRSSGYEAAAVKAEQMAAVARDNVEYPAAATRMYSLAGRLRDIARFGELLDAALDGAMTFLAADFGNIQLVHPRTNRLRIASQRGFGDAFLDYFAVVDDGQAACGTAASTRAQAVIVDVEADPSFAPHRAIAAASGFRAVQSTPLIDRAGRLRGVLSTHFVRPHRPAAHELRLTQTYARLVADAIAREPERSVDRRPSSAAWSS